MLLDWVVLIIWIVSIVGLATGYSATWLVIFVITLIYLVIRGMILIGFDLDDLF